MMEENKQKDSGEKLIKANEWVLPDKDLTNIALPEPLPLPPTENSSLPEGE